MAFSPLDLFAGGEAGYFDLVIPGVSVWQDHAGTVAAVLDGDPVLRIDDLSGNGLHAYFYSGTGVLREGASSNWYVELLSVTAYRVAGAYGGTAEAGVYLGAEGEYTSLASVNLYSTSSTRRVFWSSDQYMLHTNAGVVEAVVNETGGGTAVASAAFTTGLRVMSARASSDLLTARVDGVDGTPVAVGARGVGPALLYAFHTFAQHYYGGLHVDRELTAEELGATEGYFEGFRTTGTPAGPPQPWVDEASPVTLTWAGAVVDGATDFVFDEVSPTGLTWAGELSSAVEVRDIATSAELAWGGSVVDGVTVRVADAVTPAPVAWGGVGVEGAAALDIALFATMTWSGAFVDAATDGSTDVVGPAATTWAGEAVDAVGVVSNDTIVSAPLLWGGEFASFAGRDVDDAVLAGSVVWGGETIADIGEFRLFRLVQPAPARRTVVPVL